MAATESAEIQKANRRYMRAALAAPLLSRQRESELARRWLTDRDEAALHEMVAAHNRLVVSQAVRFRGYGLPMSDLIQEGSIGLMEGATRFDPTRGARLSTYALWWIRAAMQAYVLRHWSIVRLGSTAAEKKLFFNLRRLRAKSDSAGLGYMNPEQLADVASDLDVDIAAVETMDGRLNGNDQSLNTFLTSDTDREWQDLLPDDGPSPEETVIDERERSTRRNWLALGMDDLPAREAMIIRSRHLGEETTTLEHLGRQLGISKERVRQLERRALDRLKKSVSRRGDGGSSMTTGATARLNRPSAPGSC